MILQDKKINIEQWPIPTEDERADIIEAEEIEKVEEEQVQKQDYATIEDKDLCKYLSPRQLTFCKIFTSHEEVLWNGVRSYAKAYQIEDKIDTHYKAIQVCASRLLWNDIICRWINYILDMTFSPEHIDSQLVLLARQQSDPRIKIEAIRELNKLKGRITDKLESKVTMDWPAVIINMQPEQTK